MRKNPVFKLKMCTLACSLVLCSINVSAVNPLSDQQLQGQHISVLPLSVLNKEKETCEKIKKIKKLKPKKPTPNDANRCDDTDDGEESASDERSDDEDSDTQNSEDSDETGSEDSDSANADSKDGHESTDDENTNADASSDDSDQKNGDNSNANAENSSGTDEDNKDSQASGSSKSAQTAADAISDSDEDIEELLGLGLASELASTNVTAGVSALDAEDVSSDLLASAIDFQNQQIMSGMNAIPGGNASVLDEIALNELNKSPYSSLIDGGAANPLGKTVGSQSVGFNNSYYIYESITGGGIHRGDDLEIPSLNVPPGSVEVIGR